MAATTETQTGLDLVVGFGAYGEDYKTAFEASLLKMARFGIQLTVLDRDLTAPPGGESAGDAYIVGASATGDWSGQDDDVAIYDGAAWVFATPRIGWICYLVDEEKLTAFKAGGWSAGVAI